MLIPILLAGGVVVWLWTQRRAPLTGRRVFIDASQVPADPRPGPRFGREADIGDVIQLSPVGLRSISTSKPNLLSQYSPTEFVVLDEGRVTIAYDSGVVYVDTKPPGVVF